MTCYGLRKRHTCPGGNLVTTDPWGESWWPAFQPVFSIKLPGSPTSAQNPVFGPIGQSTCHITGIVDSPLPPPLCWGPEGQAKLSSFLYPQHIPPQLIKPTHLVAPVLLSSEFLDQRRECISVQITLQTAGEGKNKSPQRAARRRDVQSEGPGRPRRDSPG